jgi:beta-fructofuranosidase
MRLILTSIQILVLISTTVFAGNGHRRIAYWNFDTQDSWIVVEVQSRVSFPISSNVRIPEFVQGIRNEALRTDGYSTFVKGKLPEKLIGEFTISGWFALESFPTDTAGFYSLTDNSDEYAVSLAVNQFGKLMFSYGGSASHTISINAEIPRFKWFLLTTTFSKSEITVWLDDKVVGRIPIKSQIQFSNFLLGRSHREKLIHNHFPVTAINGLIDEVEIWTGTFAARDIDGLLSAVDRTLKPNLAIPATRFAGDFNRPLYHLLPASNWTNETHGLILYKGRYHIFNQKNASNLYLGQINWGHFSSTDLIHWTEHKPAVAPEPVYDRFGIWSGHVIHDERGVPLMMYTGSDGEQNILAIATPLDDNLIEWKKFSGNPVVKGAPVQFTRKDMRDPYMWHEGGDWYMMVGFGIESANVQKGAVLLYKSADLRTWKYVKPLFSGNPEADDSGIFWEMPVFWKMNGKYILLVNKVPQPGKPAVAMYWVGTFANDIFVPDDPRPQKLEAVNRMLSPSVCLDQQGRTVAIAIIPDETSAEAQLKQGWTHVYSIPRTWELKNNRIAQQPHPQLEILRSNETALGPKVLSPSDTLLISAGQKQVEIELVAKPGKASSMTLAVAKNSAGTEHTDIVFDLARKMVAVNLRHSTLNPAIKGDLREENFDFDSAELRIRIFIDGSIAEIFINDGYAFTTRMFPILQDSDRVEISCTGAEIEVSKVRTWKLNSSNNKTDW